MTLVNKEDVKAYDVLVIGAGMSGMKLALEVALTGRSVAVLEAGDLVGGRVLTVDQQPIPIELGPEFVHGDLEQTGQLLKKAGAATYEAKGSIWQHKAGELSEQEDFLEDFDELEKKYKEVGEDKPVQAFLQEELAGEKYNDLCFSLRQYVEGYYAADVSRASIAALYEEFTTGDDAQYRIHGGYQVLIDTLEKECLQQGVEFFLSRPVSEVHWKKGEATAITSGEVFRGKKLAVTVSVGVLQEEKISFVPSLPGITAAAKGLGFGHVIKLVLQFESPFWKDQSLIGGKDLSDLSFLFSGEAIPTWWTHHPEDDTVLTGWLGGPTAAEWKDLTIEQLKAKALYSLSRIFGLDVVRLDQRLTGIYFHNWSTDPRFLGAYSYEVVGGENLIKQLQQPVEDTLFFAGEGLHHGPEIGTVEGALLSGREAAHKLIASFDL